MCKYCDEESRISRVYQNCFNIWILDIESFGAEYQDFDPEETKIHYCPWCGRKLN